jgi:nicotinate-nucleotide--dimethylbenzimidazole phosphoribosyltransferase
VVVADGFISTVAVLAAAHLALAEGGTLLPALVVAHHSAEQGHGVALDALGTLADAVRDPVDAALADVRPLLALDMRLGEGSGAALALPLVRAAARLLRDMATFASAGVPGAMDAVAAGGGAA